MVQRVECSCCFARALQTLFLLKNRTCTSIKQLPVPPFPPYLSTCSPTSYFYGLAFGCPIWVGGDRLCLSVTTHFVLAWYPQSAPFGRIYVLPWADSKWTTAYSALHLGCTWTGSCSFWYFYSFFFSFFDCSFFCLQEKPSAEGPLLATHMHITNEKKKKTPFTSNIERGKTGDDGVKSAMCPKLENLEWGSRGEESPIKGDMLMSRNVELGRSVPSECQKPWEEKQKPGESDSHGG